MKTAILTAIAIFLLAAPVSAQNCWWNGIGMPRCHPGWGWRDGREWSEERREEWWHQRRHHDEEERWRRREELCRYQHRC